MVVEERAGGAGKGGRQRRPGVAGSKNFGKPSQLLGGKLIAASLSA